MISCKCNRHAIQALICTILLTTTFLIINTFFTCRVPVSASHTAIDYVEHNQISAIKQFIPWPKIPVPQEDRSYLIIFDIDNTVAEPAGTSWGSDQWFYAKVAQYEEKGMSHQDALNKTVEQLIAIQDVINLAPVEKNTVPFIKELQERNFTTIALTARSCQLINRTIEQLKEMGVDFTINATFKNNVSLNTPHPACYRNGMLFTGANDKGEVLKIWLAQEQYRPNKIIFIDDKMHNLEAVGRAARSMHIPFVGIRYKKLDKKIKAFRLEDVKEPDPLVIEAYPY